MLAAGIRRACNGTLQSAGWKGLGRLMPRPQKGTEIVRLLVLEDLPDRPVPYATVLRRWEADGRRVVV
jgi:hypothetical protein